MSENEEINIPEKFEYIEGLKWIAVIVFVVTMFLYFCTFPGSIPDARSDWGVFGDYLGGTLNPIFAFLSLLAIIYTIRIQTIELELSRKAIEETQKEMATSSQAQIAQSKAFDIQNISVKQQTFENTFFKLLELHNELISDMYKHIEPDTENKDRSRKNGLLVTILIEAETMEAFQMYNESIVKTYFMTLYQILKFVDLQEQKFKEENFFNAKLYTNIVRATLDDALLCLLAINASLDSFVKFRVLLEKFSFFEHINLNFLMFHPYETVTIPEMMNILKVYDKKVFGSNQIVESFNESTCAQTVSE